MKCSKCLSENREGAKFCNECGHKLELACPKCRNLNNPESKFCDECGHDLSKPSAPAKSSELSQSFRELSEIAESPPCLKVNAARRQSYSPIFPDIQQ